MSAATSGTTGQAVCRTDGRRGRVRAARLAGVDAVEAGDDGLTLTVTFLGRAPHGLRPENVRIDGGRRITGIEAVAVEVVREEDPELDDRLYVTVDRTGDTGRYRLAIVDTDPYGRPGTEPFRGFDQRYHAADFTFAPDRPAPLDCRDHRSTPPETFRSAAPATGPAIDYVARDYESLRRLILDRLALTVPEMVERNAADLGTTLTELLAYTADQISYQQDAIATEAYLDTARRRISVRRHVRLIDYPMHDGCTARAFVTLEAARPLTLLAGTYRFAAVDVGRLGPRDRPGLGTVIDDGDLTVLDERGSVEVFEPVGDAPLRLHPAHNEILFWTWGDEQCLLPRGATAATLRDGWAEESAGGRAAGRGGERTGRPERDQPETDRPDAVHPEAVPEQSDAPAHGRHRHRRLALRPGDLLLLEEVKGPRSGTPGDADPRNRQVVRLTSVTPAVDRLCGQPVLEVTWAAEDALTFALHLSTVGGADCAPVADVSVARGNVALVDHGRSLAFGGGPPERITVPPVPAVIAPCEPPAFGCPDTAEGNRPGELIQDRLKQTRAGHTLTPDQVRELFTVVGEEATGRAGIGIELAGRRRERTTPETAYAQAEALEALLAQSVYPGIAPRFGPLLHRSPVVQAVPFPEPKHVSAGQAERLAAIPGRVRQRLVELWRSARDRDGLSDGEIAELTVLFGLPVLERLELRRHPVRALRELLHRSERLLAAKLDRLQVLTARARAGRVLDGRTAWEIAHSWGPGYAEGLHPREPVLFGPAAALLPDPRAALPAVRLTSVPDTAAGAVTEPPPAGPAQLTADTGTAGTSEVTEVAEDAEHAGGAGDDPRTVWEPRRDLLDSGPRDHHFVGELRDDGRLVLRFGDGHHGARPEPGSTLEVRYRLGGGSAGNVPAEAISHLVLRRDGGAVDRGEPMPVAGVRNPLPAVGGTEPEPLEQVRRLAPLELRRVRLRAVTAEDYASLASALPGVQRAAAELRWTGGGREAHIAVDARGTAEPPAELLDSVAHALERFRRIGHDLVVRPARLVPLDIELEVCAAPGHQHGQILAELHRVLGNRRLPGGRLGFFHPDALGFGRPVRLSRLVAVAMAVPGVVDVRVSRLRRLFEDASTGGAAGDRSAEPPARPARDGLLRIGPLEVAQCDNDPDRPENGRLVLKLGGNR
ncbi:putative baseplate assembly protein [Streptomyces sp. TP-A0874]|uniref:putative baseplate assembly protein n=1 Tax=Streptomyces sp. TP-A0874 TaxID=549819 RepID=UPI000853E21D|nr:putative baseplate assembly protein [Streptomyces sp. TP-A0874]